MDSFKAEFDEMCIIQDRNNRSRMDKKKQVGEEGDDDGKYKSKNLKAERRRRKKLSDRQLELLSLVPIITNMNKATIITDAITYIEELKKTVEELSDQLRKMEATSFDEEKIKLEEINDGNKMKKWGATQPEVDVSQISGTKLWIKIIFQKKRGRLTKLMEAITVLGFDLSDTSITTCRGAVLFTSFGEGIHGRLPDANKIKKYLLEIVRSI